jgi:hypothetical protein
MKEELDVTVTLKEVIIEQSAQSNTKKKRTKKRARQRNPCPWKFKGLHACLYEPLRKKHKIYLHVSRKMKLFAEMIDRCVSAGLG